MSSAKNVSDFRRRRKANLVDVMDNKCAICGYDKMTSALEFHHINAEEKSYGISAHGTCHDLEKDLAEIKKCILVCANCHREIHNNLYSKEELFLKQNYNEEKAELLRQDKISKTTATEHFCKKCGKKISRGAKTGLCEDCYRAEQKILSGRPSREELKELIRTQPFTHIGEAFGVTDNSVRKWCKSENLPYRKKDINAISDQDWEKI